MFIRIKIITKIFGGGVEVFTCNPSCPGEIKAA